jgi:hypothetical protein
MNHVYLAEPCLSPPPPTFAALLEGQVEAEVHYQRHDAPALDFERALAEALGDQCLDKLALYLRRRDRAAVFDEIERLFDLHWSRSIRNRLEGEVRARKASAA